MIGSFGIAGGLGSWLLKTGPYLPWLSTILKASWRAHEWGREIFAQEQECETPEWARDNLASRAATFGSRATSAPLIHRRVR